MTDIQLAFYIGSGLGVIIGVITTRIYMHLRR